MLNGLTALLAAAAIDAFLAEAVRPGRDGAWVRQKLAARGGAPLVDGDELLFLAEARGPVAPRIVSDLTGWQPGLPGAQPGSMLPLGATGYFALRARAERAAWIEYVLERCGERAPDPHNPRHVEHAGSKRSVVVMPEHGSHPEAEPAADVPAGRLVPLAVESRAFSGTRNASVYLPPGYDAGAARYPTLYLHDGSLYVRYAGLPRTLDALIASSRLPPVIAVLTDPVARREEYSTNASHRSFVADELVSAVDARFRTVASPGARAVIGASRGAQATLDIALAHPDVFGACGLVLPATGGGDLLLRARQGGRRPLDCAMAVGLYDLDYLDDGRQLLGALAPVLRSVRYRELPIGHSIQGAARHFDDLLADMGWLTR